MPETVDLSVVVPCYNEADVLEQTHTRLASVLEGLQLEWEIIYVDDGSRDATPELIRSLCQSESRARLIRFSRNFGHQIAVTAGLDHAAGDAVVIIDADLQDPPEVIEEMVKAWEEGADVAYGLRIERDGESWFKLATARLFYRLLGAISSTPIHMDTGDFRLIDRKVVDALKQMPERDRFLRGMVSWVGFKQVPVPYRRAARAAGVSKYPLRKMLRFATDGVLSFSTMPLRAATLLGFVALLFALVGIAYALVLRLFTEIWVSGWTLMFIAMLFIGGVQLMILGVIGEYVGRIYIENKQRPAYIISETVGLESPSKLEA